MTMLSVAEARAQVRKRLSSSMAAWAAEPVSEVRVEIALKAPTEKQVLADQAAAADWAASWRAVEILPLPRTTQRSMLRATPRLCQTSRAEVSVVSVHVRRVKP